MGLQLVNKYLEYFTLFYLCLIAFFCSVYAFDYFSWEVGIIYIIAYVLLSIVAQKNDDNAEYQLGK